MAGKTIKVDEGVHERLEQKKVEYGVDTFNDVLKRMLGITPSPTVEELGAFLTDEQREAGEQIVRAIEDIGNLERRVNDDHYNDRLEFVAPESGLVISYLQFSEDILSIYYRNSSDEMTRIGLVQKSSSGEILYGRSSGSEQHDVDYVLEAVEDKVSGAYRRWGSS